MKEDQIDQCCEELRQRIEALKTLASTRMRPARRQQVRRQLNLMLIELRKLLREGTVQ